MAVVRRLYERKFFCVAGAKREDTVHSREEPYPVRRLSGQVPRSHDVSRKFQFHLRRSAAHVPNIPPTPRLGRPQWLFLVLLIIAPMARAQTPDFDGRGGQISGIVIFQPANRPAGGVVMNVRSLSGGPSVSVLTDMSGNFQVRGIPLGPYEVAVDEPGFELARTTVQAAPVSPKLRLYLRAPYSPHADGAGPIVSVRELRIPEKARSQFEKGLDRLAKHDLPGSLKNFEQAVAAYPAYYEAYYEMGVAELKLGREDEAAQAFQKSIDASGGRYAAAQFGLGLVVCEKGNAAEGEAIIRRGLEVDSTSAVGHLLLGLALHVQNRSAEAEKSARAAVLRKPDLASAYLLLADVHRRKREYASLREDLDAYLRLEPTGPTSDRARRVRESIEKFLPGADQPLKPITQP